MNRRAVLAAYAAELEALGLPADPAPDLVGAEFVAGPSLAGIVDELIARRRGGLAAFAAAGSSIVVGTVGGAPTLDDELSKVRRQVRADYRAALRAARDAERARGLSWERIAHRLGTTRKTLRDLDRNAAETIQPKPAETRHPRRAA